MYDFMKYFVIMLNVVTKISNGRSITERRERDANTAKTTLTNSFHRFCQKHANVPKNISSRFIIAICTYFNIYVHMFYHKSVNNKC